MSNLPPVTDDLFVRPRQHADRAGSEAGNEDRHFRNAEPLDIAPHRRLLELPHVPDGQGEGDLPYHVERELQAHRTRKEHQVHEWWSRLLSQIHQSRGIAAKNEGAVTTTANTITATPVLAAFMSRDIGRWLDTD